MRILFGFAGGRGHVEPLLPIARAAAAAGHAVALSGRASVVAAIDARGLEVLPDPWAPQDEPRPITPLLELDPAREDADLRRGFAGRLPRERAARMLELGAGWTPDVVVCDETDFGGLIAAERVRLPYASVLVIAAGSFVRPEVVAQPLDVLRAEHRLAPDPELRAPSRHLALAPCPPSFRDPAFPLPPTGVAIRPGKPGPPPPRRMGRRARPLVYFTLGTVFNVESGDLFARVLAGLRDLPADVLVTLGGHLDPALLGPQPPHVRVERHVAQATVLPGCDLMISHGGSGSVVGALAAGVPLVVLPMGADQPANAARCAALGAGVVLDAVRATPETVRDAAASVLARPAYQAAAGRLRDEAAALPPPEHAVALLERLARTASARPGPA
jgi:UDP:flavonoid glycosyltransferase YjiC (YdhE family)